MDRTSGTHLIPRPSLEVSTSSLPVLPDEMPQSLLDDLLITYSLLETEQYEALTLEQVGELRRSQAQLDQRLREMQERITLEKKMRHAAQSVQSSLLHTSPSRLRLYGTSPHTYMTEALQRTDEIMLQFLHVSDARHDIQRRLLAHHIAVLRDHLHSAPSPMPVSPSLHTSRSDAMLLARLSTTPSNLPGTPQGAARLWTERSLPSRSGSLCSTRSPALGGDEADDNSNVSRLLHEVDQLQERRRGLTAQLSSNSERQAALRRRLSRLCEDNRAVAERLAQHELDWPSPTLTVPHDEHEQVVQALERERAKVQALESEQAQAWQAQAAHAQALERLREEHAQALEDLRKEYAQTMEDVHTELFQLRQHAETTEAEHAQAMERVHKDHQEALGQAHKEHAEALDQLQTLQAEHAALQQEAAKQKDTLAAREAAYREALAAHEAEFSDARSAYEAQLADASHVQEQREQDEASLAPRPSASVAPTPRASPPSVRRAEASPREGPPGTLSQRLQRMFSGDRPATDELAAAEPRTSELVQLREQLEAEREQKDMVAHRLEEVMMLYRSAVSQPAVHVPVIREPIPPHAEAQSIEAQPNEVQPVEAQPDETRPKEAQPKEAQPIEAPSNEAQRADTLSPETIEVPHTPLGPPTPPEVPSTPHRAERPDLYVDVVGTPTHTRMGSSRHRFLEMEVDRLRRAAEQARVAYEQLRQRSEAERRASERERQLVDTWTSEWQALCARLEQQHHFCMRVLGKADGREEMDGLLDQIKASSAGARRSMPSADAGADAARLLGQVEEHIGDMAEGLARAGASGLGGNVIAQLEDRIEELEAQLAQRDTSSGDVSQSSLSDAPLDVCLYALVLIGTLLPEGDALLHSMSLPLDAVRRLFAPPTATDEADALDTLRRVPALDTACSLAHASGAAARRALGHAFAARVMDTAHTLAVDAHRQVPALVTDVMGRLASTLDTSEMLTDRALVLEESLRRATFASNPPTPQPDTIDVPPM
ncbi:hypothetical protein MNAN1_003183 [Malassezia nana]|uniref:Up-regulated during septation protein 1 domain-containing protein n=1 Tax=Malassezia nana TaxID=180528 RepID=A0AAF0J3M8_9BASI|nr:hypothetical protein MNAN1_003183 [Malassezia nana]